MNLYDKESQDVFFVNFNQNCTTLSVATKKWFRLYNINQIDNMDIIHESATPDICIVERLFTSNLTAMVLRSAPRKLKVCNFKKGKELCNYSYSNTILSVRLNRVRLVVCLEESLYIHDIKDMRILHIIRDTPPNITGLCVLSINDQNCYLAYPGSSSTGEVQIFDAVNLQAKSVIPAHDNPLAAMAFNPTGTKLATASKKGTIIRVFNVADGTELHKFRRGLSRSASIYSLSFSDNSMLLSASSNTETVHIFKLEDAKEVKQEEEPEGWMSYMGKAFVRSATYFPSQVADVFSHGRSFAAVHLPFSGLRNVCSLVTIQKVPRIVIVASNGSVYFYDFNPAEGGDCTLAQTHSIYAPDEDLDEEQETIVTTEAATTPTSLPDPTNIRQPSQSATPSKVIGFESVHSSPKPTADRDSLMFQDEDFPPMMSS